MAEHLEVSVDLTNQKVRFEGGAKDNQEIIIDFKPPVGDGDGYTSLELLLLSLASCSGSTIVSLLRKMRKNISGFRVTAKGIMREQLPLSFQKIYLDFILFSANAEEADIQKAIDLAEETYSPVWAMLKSKVEICCGYKIINYKPELDQRAKKLTIH
jgi:putative redox protein